MEYDLSDIKGMNIEVFKDIHGTDPSNDFNWFEETEAPGGEHLIQDNCEAGPKKSGLFEFISRRRDSSFDESRSRGSSFGFGRSRTSSAAKVVRKSSKTSRSRARSYELSVPVPVDHCVGSDAEKRKFHSLYRSAQNGLLLDIFTLAKMYELGTDGVTMDTGEAIRWYTEGSNTCSSMDCEFSLGSLYATGHKGKIDANPAEALYWYTKAAERGHWVAQFRVGLMYIAGDGLEEINPTVSFRWFKRSAKQGYGAAASNVGVMYFYGIGVEENPKKAFKWMKKASATGVPIAVHNLAVMYRFGLGTAESYAKFQDLHDRAMGNKGIDGISDSVSQKAIERKGLFLYRGMSIVPAIIVKD